MNPIAVRLLSQQLVKPLYSSPHDVVAHFGAIQAQDYRMARWAVAMRTKDVSTDAFRSDFDNGKIVRLHLLRGTWQLIAGDDYWWMLSLYAKRAERVIRGWMKANKVTIDDGELHKVRDAITEICTSQGNATKDDFANGLERKGITMDSHRLSYHMRLAETDGILCSGNLSPLRATYTLAETKIPKSPPMEKDEMLTLLTRKYFQSHSPASFADFVWWSGLTATECRRGIALSGNELSKFSHKGNELYIHESCRTKGYRNGVTLLLPPFDEYLIGYKSRSLVLAPEHTARAHTRNGIFFPIIAHNGIICGNWSPWNTGLSVSYFTPEESHHTVERQWRNFRKLWQDNNQNG